MFVIYIYIISIIIIDVLKLYLKLTRIYYNHALSSYNIMYSKIL